VNVIFHTLGSLATAAVLNDRISQGRFAYSYSRIAGGGFAGIVLHGVLDYCPHTYPVEPKLDVGLSLLLFTVSLLLVSKRNWLLLGFCFVGALLPDLIDLGPAILNKSTGWSLPVVKVFPWHWPQYSGSIYDHNHNIESLSWHVLMLCVISIVLYTRGPRLLNRREE
jgi:hypothetical protein